MVILTENQQKELFDMFKHEARNYTLLMKSVVIYRDNEDTLEKGMKMRVIANERDEKIKQFKSILKIND